MFNKKTYQWEMTRAWNGKVETVLCENHSYAWTGSIPNTGIRACLHCGRPEDPEDMEIFIASEQPEKCRYCMVRTEMLEQGNGYTIEKCPKCGITYRLEDPEEDDEENC